MPLDLDVATRTRLLNRRVHRDEEPDEFVGREGEVGAYLARAAGRFATTLAMLEAAVPAPAEILELGADPWLFTQLLLERGYRIVSAGERRGVWREDESWRSPQRVRLEWNGRGETFDHHLFNAERDRWPFDDGAFACILCAEVLEHLVYSPAHVLYEASRVLAPGGVLVVTTPNALAATKLARLVRGRTVHHPYSGYGARGRHNREFTPDELRGLLDGAGLDAVVRTANLVGYETREPLGRIARALPLASRRDHLFAVARKVGPPRLVFVEGLYRSVDRDRMRAEGVLFPDE